MKKCLLIIGHTEKSPGAINSNSGISEFEFNDNLAWRTPSNNCIRPYYRTSYKSLPLEANRMRPDFIIELHCNAFNKKASGTEMLYYHGSEKGRQMAEILQNEIVNCLGLADRGIKPKTEKDRGGYLLKHTKAPCVIAESFFIDNNKDLKTAQDNIEALAEAYGRAIDKIAEVI